MQSVGKLDNQHPYILCHGKKHFAYIFRLFLLRRVELQLVEFGNAFYQIGYFVAEFRSYFFVCHVGVFYGVVKQGGAYCGHVKSQIHKNVGHDSGMSDIRSAACSELSVVRGESKVKRLFDYPFVLGIIISDL